jgi:predicted transcriptional regulator
MRPLDGATELFECDSCGNVGLGTGEIRCCDRPMRPVGGRGADGGPDPTAVSEPTLADLLGAVFDMSDTELELCLCVMEGGELTVADLAEQTAYDRSVVTRHLNHLADLNVVEKRRRLLESGGQVYVYTPATPEVVRRNLTRLFVHWVGQASARLDDLQREKVEAIVERASDEPQWRIFQKE